MISNIRLWWLAPRVDGRGVFLPGIHIRPDIYDEIENGMPTYAGCLDAPDSMPAGGCWTNNVGDYYFASQIRFVRGE